MRPFAFLVGSCVLSAGAFAFHGFPAGNERDPGMRVPPPPVNSVVAGVLYRVGLSAETLASCGVTGPQVSGMIGAALALYDPVTLRSRSEAHALAAAEESRLAGIARSGLASPDDLAALATARTTLVQAKAALTSYLDAMRVAACAGVASAQGTQIQTSHANRAWDLAAPYLVKDRSQESWVALREALDTKRISEVHGYPFPSSSQSILASIEAEPEIALARSNLDANLFDVQTAWNLAADADSQPR